MRHVASDLSIGVTCSKYYFLIGYEASCRIPTCLTTLCVQVKVHRYWPGKHPANISTLMAEMTNETVYEDYILREIKLTNTKVSMVYDYCRAIKRTDRSTL